jgi:type II protein arginine methyltransferase
MVLGAGRGPLVKCVLRAAKSAMRTVVVFAVEKNPNAIVTLRNMKKELEWDNVTVIASDMRRLEGVIRADIIVSELLGSFGDNELSPECLDGANKLLKEGGVLAPLSSTKLHNEVKAYGTSISQMETAYVVRIHRGRTLANAKPCFTFSHPNRDAVIDNSRYAKLQFDVEEANVMHGFAGYFETTLYGQVKLSILPETFSEGMFSWFPLYFPIATPVYAQAGKPITVHMWRRSSSTKVWYEWAVSDPTTTAIHNPNGRSYSFALN